MKRLKLVLLAVAVGVAMIAAISSLGMAQPQPMQPFNVTPTYQDVPYANASDTQKLDLYLPSGDDGPFPTVIYTHGGAFQFGDKTMLPGGLGEALLNEGYAVVGVDYRLSGEAQFPAAVQDAKAAVRFHAGRWSKPSIGLRVR